MSYDYLAEAEALFDYTRELRRDFHRHPELGFQEVRTAGIVARELSALGMEVRTGVAETGVVGLLEGDKAGPVILLRFDMDALPVQEKTGAPYASEVPGVMHACGHDGHTAIGLTVARMLAARSSELSGQIKFIFQPAEEGLNGAARMIEQGVLDNPRPIAALALHLWNVRPLGWVGVSAGAVMAASEEFKLVVQGDGGHGAAPHLTVDPVMAAAQIITAAQSVVSRNVPPLHAAVVSFTSLSGGSAYNVIPAEVVLKGTIRAFDPEVHERVLSRFREVVNGVAAAMGCQVVLEFLEGTPAVENDPELAAAIQGLVPGVLPDAHLDIQNRTMGSEDMAFFLQKVPGCYYFVGSANPDKDLNAAHHSPFFDFDENAMPWAAALMVAAAEELLSRGTKPT